MDAKVLENNKDYSVEEIEYDPEDVSHAFLGKVINKTNNVLRFEFDEDSCLVIAPKEQIMFINGRDNYEWDFITKKNYKYSLERTC